MKVNSIGLGDKFNIVIDNSTSLPILYLPLLVQTSTKTPLFTKDIFYYAFISLLPNVTVKAITMIAKRVLKPSTGDDLNSVPPT